jgi:peptide/nickel transport system substrate-binding protein
MRPMKVVSVLVILTMLLAGLSACKPAEPVYEDVPVPEGDTFNLRIAEDPESLDNVRTTSGAAESVMALTFLERLTYIDENNVIHGWLAESWTVSDDQREVTFSLRQGIKFTDGTDFNAEAVKFHFDRILDPDNVSPVKAYYGSLQEAVVLDTYTVKLVFEEPFAGLWNVLNYAYSGFNSPAAVEKWGDEYGRHPIGTGPFMLKEWLPGSSLTFVRNPDYVQVREDAINQGPALLAQIKFLVIPEDGTAMAALQTGELDASILNADTLPQVEGNPLFNIYINKNTTSIQFIEFNCEKPPFDDPQFRTAIGYAVDREAIVESSRGGYSTLAYSPLAPGLMGYDEAIAQEYGTPYDPDKARQLLAELGWEDTDGDGIREKDGQKASFGMWSYSGYAYVIRSLEILQQNFLDVGIEITIKQSDWGAFYPSLKKDSLDMDLMRWTWGDMDVLTVLFRSPGHRGHILPDAELDTVLDSIESTMDYDQRIELAHQAQILLLQKMIVVPIQADWTLYALKANVRDFHGDHYGYLLSGDVWFEK